MIGLDDASAIWNRLKATGNSWRSSDSSDSHSTNSGWKNGGPASTTRLEKEEKERNEYVNFQVIRLAVLWSWQYQNSWITAIYSREPKSSIATHSATKAQECRPGKSRFLIKFSCFFQFLKMNFVEVFVRYILKSKIYHNIEKLLAFWSFKWIEWIHPRRFWQNYSRFLIKFSYFFRFLKMNFVENFVWYNLKSNFYNSSEQSLTFLSFKWIEWRHTKMFCWQTYSKFLIKFSFFSQFLKMNFVENFVCFNLHSSFYHSSELILTFWSFKWIEWSRPRDFW